MLRRDTVIAAQRFGFGEPPATLEIIDKDPHGWLKAQLQPESQLPAPLRNLPTTADDLTAFNRFQRERRAMQQANVEGNVGGNVGGNARDDVPPRVRMAYRNTLRARYAGAVLARFRTAVTTPAPFFERLVHFWSNHFVVSGAKPASSTMPPSYERDVIRPHVLGRFEDMLVAAVKHPAMLVYLDNVQSIGPNSTIARNRAMRQRRSARLGGPAGLNENLAREILELHSVGVNGGYSQEDVTSFAKVITGWGNFMPRQRRAFSMMDMSGNNATGGELFQFNSAAHEPGSQVVMGTRYSERGVKQGEAVLHDLAIHPATACHIATKLARYFVANDPPAALVDRLAESFENTGGDLAAVTQTLIAAPEAWAVDRAKFKQPEEYVISVVRSLGGPELREQQLLASLDAMGQRPYRPPGPDGWPDGEAHWLSPDGLWKRIEWAELAGRRMAGDVSTPVKLAETLFGETLSADTRRTVGRAESSAQGVALLLAAPEFMRR